MNIFKDMISKKDIAIGLSSAIFLVLFLAEANSFFFYITGLWFGSYFGKESEKEKIRKMNI